MKALISPKQDNYAVQVEPDDNIFPIGLPLYWTPCPDYIVAYNYYYDSETKDFILKNNVTEIDVIDASQVVY